MVTEGTNLYWTLVRFNNSFALMTTDNLNVGTINRYYLTSLFNADLATKTTDNLTVGTLNIIYNDYKKEDEGEKYCN